MTLDELTRRYPDIEVDELLPLFPAIPLADYPDLAGYTREQVHEGAMGPGGLFLASDMARLLDLRPGMRVLDLGPGRCASSCFLAKHYGVKVVAADLWVDPSRNWERIVAAGLQDLVMPMRAEAHDLPFADGYFDAVFCMDAYHCFGTDDFYLKYLCKLVRPGARICIGGPCYADELTDAVPKEWLHGESQAYHSPSWWEQHFHRSGLVDVLHCQVHLKGRELWLDDVRRNLSASPHPRDREPRARKSLLNDLIVLLQDTQRFSTHFMLLAQKQ